MIPVAAIAPARARRRYDWYPAATGAAVGLAAGAVNAFVPLPGWRNGAFKGVVLGAGVLGHFMGWDPDLSYGLQCSGLTLITQQVGPAIKAKKLGVLYTDEYAAAPSRAHRPARAAVTANGHAAGCSGCAQRAGLRSPEFEGGDTFTPAEIDVPTPEIPNLREEAAGIL